MKTSLINQTSKRICPINKTYMDDLVKKLLVICGPTASGKTDTAISLAKQFSGELVSADSRQVYKELDIVTGKDIPKEAKLEIKNSHFGIANQHFTVGYRTKEEISLWLTDIVKPDYIFNVGEYAQLARQVIVDIDKRNKLPIVVGGSGLYINSVLSPLTHISIPPNTRLRKQLDHISKDELQRKLQTIDKKRWERMNNSDRQNPRRLIRAIEIAQSDPGQPVIFQPVAKDVLRIGLQISSQGIYESIKNRVLKRIKIGALEEAQQILQKYTDQTLPSISSTGIKQLKEFFEKRESMDVAVEKWIRAETQYAKRQMTWFKKEKDVVWFDTQKEGYVTEIEDRVRTWYTRG